MWEKRCGVQMRDEGVGKVSDEEGEEREQC